MGTRKAHVAIVGRPNVGKSTFFNKVIGKRLSIVKNEPGITRDRLYYDVEWCGHQFVLVDTGGLELKSEDIMWGHIRSQVDAAVDIADVILFFVDGKSGIVSSDYEVAKFLRQSGKPIIVVVNKIDNNEEEMIYDFYALGFDSVFGISAEHSKGIGDVLDEICSKLPDIEFEDEEKDVLNIAIVGKPNVGKSSIVNKLLGYDRVIVSDIAGTTRDSIDTEFTYKDKTYNIIDTAGMRKKNKIDSSVEFYSTVRAKNSIRRADIVLIVLDASEEVSEQDVRICGYVHEEGKPSLILMNKWDLVEKDDKTIYKMEANLKNQIKFMDYMVTMYISALTGQRISNIMDKLNEIYQESQKRITTGVLNEVLREAIMVNEPPFTGGKRLKIYYMTQVSVSPIVFLIFVNDAELMHFSYKRYLENSIRDAFAFKGSPIKLILRDKTEEL